MTGPSRSLDDAVQVLRAAKTLLVTGHRKPDGDAVGSMVALAQLFAAQGRQVTLYNPDLVPRNLKWLPGVKKLVHRLKKTARFDATVIVDCGDEALLGDEFPAPEVTGPRIAFDHHASARPFGEYFLSDPEAASVGVMIARLADRLGWALPPEAGVGVFVSLVADTGWFRYANANAEAYRLAATIVDRGDVDPWQVSERLNENVPVSRYRLLAAALGSLELTDSGKLAFITLTDAMVKEAKATWEDSEGIVNYARAIAGVECGVLLSPARGGGVRVSLRSRGRAIDAGAVCAELGGGGHAGAAGCRLATDLAGAREQVEKALRQTLAQAAAGGG